MALIVPTAPIVAVEVCVSTVAFGTPVVSRIYSPNSRDQEPFQELGALQTKCNHVI